VLKYVSENLRADRWSHLRLNKTLIEKAFQKTYNRKCVCVYLNIKCHDKNKRDIIYNAILV
jgi:hypothetical protein